ncbi:hypothetical protein EH243_05725 [Amphritea opalescens]|uniref:Uncharacterized protein n=1 Tax=Amphritea opalescens TaxID=2490544 RepID=A0A430KT07_9GAMM|nr:hypothetical protein [Amphritea opalescens]RTE66588.1 hypothetical protein EH243_05725 [Amphritea opalescens]
MKLKNRRWIVVFFAGLLSLSVLSITGCQEEPEPEPEAKPVVLTIDTTDPQAFVRHIVGEYLVITDQLVSQYQHFKAAKDTQGFILYRNNHWTPTYIDSKRSYEKTLFNQKAYIYRQQLNGLFDLFFELQKLSILLKHSLLKEDWGLEEQAMSRIAKDRLLMMKYLKAEDVGKGVFRSSTDS